MVFGVCVYVCVCSYQVLVVFDPVCMCVCVCVLLSGMVVFDPVCMCVCVCVLLSGAGGV